MLLSVPLVVVVLPDEPVVDGPVGPLISVVDTEEKLNYAIAQIEAMMQDALIVLSDVDMIRLVRTDANG